MDFRTGRMLRAGNDTDSGVPVSSEGALSFHAWYRAMSLISQKCASVPRHLYKPGKAGMGRAAVTDHDAYRLVNRRANSEQSAFQFWLQMSGHVVSRGNGYAAIERVELSGPLTELIPMDPDRTYPVRSDGAVWYVVFPFGYDGPGYKLRASEVLHFKGFGFDGLKGYPVWQVAAGEVGLGLAERKLESARYRNGGRPGVILQTDQTLNDKTRLRIRNEWERMHTGLDNAGKTAVLDKGLKAEVIALSAEELAQTAAAQMSLTAISNFTGVPVSKLGGVKSGASQEQEDRAFINDGLDFHVALQDDECTHKLLTDAEQEKEFIFIGDREALIRPDIQTKYEILRIGTAGRAFVTPNEAREVIDMPPSDEADANQLLTPLNMGTGGKKNEPTDPAGPGPGAPPSGKPPADGSTPTPGPAPAPAPAAPPSSSAPDLTRLREASRFALAHATTKMLKRVGLAAVTAAGKGSVAFVSFVRNLEIHNRAVFKAEFLAAERVARALSKDDQPKDGHAAEYLLSVLAHEWGRLQDDATEKTIAAKAEALYAQQLLQLPQQVIFVMTPDPDPKEEKS